MSVNQDRTVIVSNWEDRTVNIILYLSMRLYQQETSYGDRTDLEDREINNDSKWNIQMDATLS